MKKIFFLVDNGLNIRMLYDEKLARLGLEVTTSNDSEALYAKIDHNKFDIIFTDLRRWEELKGYPSFRYDTESAPSGYVICRAEGSHCLDIRVKAITGKDMESLEVVLVKGTRPVQQRIGINILPERPFWGETSSRP